eukprot:scaffold1242_cov261-Pinguiococcus_pyrenoidosus.AAC.2
MGPQEQLDRVQPARAGLHALPKLGALRQLQRAGRSGVVAAPVRIGLLLGHRGVPLVLRVEQDASRRDERAHRDDGDAQAVQQEAKPRVRHHEHGQAEHHPGGHQRQRGADGMLDFTGGRKGPREHQPRHDRSQRQHQDVHRRSHRKDIQRTGLQRVVRLPRLEGADAQGTLDGCDLVAAVVLHDRAAHVVKGLVLERPAQLELGLRDLARLVHQAADVGPLGHRVGVAGQRAQQQQHVVQQHGRLGVEDLHVRQRVVLLLQPRKHHAEQHEPAGENREHRRRRRQEGGPDGQGRHAKNVQHQQHLAAQRLLLHVIVFQALGHSRAGLCVASPPEMSTVFKHTPQRRNKRHAPLRKKRPSWASWPP